MFTHLKQARTPTLVITVILALIGGMVSFLATTGSASAANSVIYNKWASKNQYGVYFSDILRASTSKEFNPWTPGTQYQLFQGGSIMNSKYGVHVMQGEIAVKFRTLGTTDFGAPTSDEVGPLRVHGGYVSRFKRLDNGEDRYIYWAPGNGAHAVQGLILVKYRNTGYENNYLGYPTTDEVPLPGGAFNHFDGGSIYWSPQTGPNVIRGAIRNKWAAMGWENSKLGYPTTDERTIKCTNLPYTGRDFRQEFQKGSIEWCGGIAIARDLRGNTIR